LESGGKDSIVFKRKLSLSNRQDKRNAGEGKIEAGERPKTIEKDVKGEKGHMKEKD